MQDRSWQLAQLGIKQSGLGIRCVSQHAPAAYLASLSSASELCKSIDPEFDPSDEQGCSKLNQVFEELRSKWEKKDCFDLTTETTRSTTPTPTA